MSAKKVIPTETPDKKRSRISQEDVPAYSLGDALRVATALHESFGRKPAIPTRVAGALELSPSSSLFKMLCGASIAYGLTTGGYNAQSISMTELADSILRPKKEGEDLAAKRQAFLRPRIIKKFLEHYNGGPLPQEKIACHVMEDMGVPSERAAEIFKIISAEAAKLGLTHIIKGKHYVDLTGSLPDANQGAEFEEPNIEEQPKQLSTPELTNKPKEIVPQVSLQNSPRLKRVFITHGKNREFVDPIKKLLDFGELEAVVSVERASVSQPVPDKVMNDMRSCGGAIIHVEGETTLIDSSGEQVVVLNPNVLIEIGAAMALYGRRFILLVRQGVKLPSNLQGLFEVRYDGETLTGNATIELLQSIVSLKKEAMPKGEI